MGNLKKKIHVKVPIRKQPDDVTCGPTCLHSIYEFHQDKIALEQVIKGVSMLETGGTFASQLGVHALKRGYQAEIWSFNVNIFDPTWFELPAKQLSEKLILQRHAKKQRKLRTASDGYIEFLEHGGILRFEDLNLELLVSCLQDGNPLIAGLSSTYLYKSAREDPKTCENNDIKGRPSGHFVVLTEIEKDSKMVQISDPYFPNSLSDQYTYTVSIDRLICAILLGVVTYDANLLMIYKKDGKNEEPHRS